MKKVLLMLALIGMFSSANAQMVDQMGAMAIQGMISADAYRGVNQMQGAMNQANFKQDLSMLLMQLQTSMMGGYSGVSKQSLGFSGFSGIDWDIVENGGGYYLEFKNLDAALCFVCKSREWSYNRIDINGGGDCTSDSNNVKMYY
ncbi:MAG: hypothetical protein ILA52_01730 [Alphaproteobacteria bacterium]|nr:hypothetical protein [Alphaproteobacteria bacterium]